jgi:membrane-associated phospholipid phosphatase
VGPVSAALIATLATMTVAALWLAYNERRVRSVVSAVWRAVVRWTRIHIGERLPPCLPERRFGVGEAALLTVVGGLIALCGLAVVFANLLDSVLEADGIARVDRPLSGWLAAHREHGLTLVMLRALTELAVVCAGTAWRTRSRLPVLLGVLGVSGVGVAVTVVKLVVARHRPPMPYTAITADGYSFPSGHATGMTVWALVAGWMISHWIVRSWNTRVAVWTAVLVIIGGVGFTRIYLGVHYLSDVIAGWVLGAAWAGVLVACALLWEHARDGSGGHR